MRRVAVTGLGCVTPVGNNVNSFWDSLINGRHGFATITRYDASEMKVKIAGEVKDFKPEEYIEKSEIRKTDLYCQFALAAAAQAVADSGIEGNVTPERFGVYVGSGIGGFITMHKQADVLSSRGADRVSPFLVPMMIANMGSALIAIKYNARGVNLPVVSACATGTHSIGEAFRAVKHGYADVILTGGAEASVTQLGVVPSAARLLCV